MNKSIVCRHKDSCNNVKVLASRIYEDLKAINYTDEDLIAVYKDMTLYSLSTYELERLTKKQMFSTPEGYVLEDIDRDKEVFDNVNIVFNKDNIIKDELNRNGRDESLLDKVKKYLPTADVSAETLRSNVRKVLEWL